MCIIHIYIYNYTDIYIYILYDPILVGKNTMVNPVELPIPREPARHSCDAARCQSVNSPYLVRCVAELTMEEAMQRTKTSGCV